MNAEANTDTTSSDSLEEGQDDDGLYDYCISDIKCTCIVLTADNERSPQSQSQRCFYKRMHGSCAGWS